MSKSGKIVVLSAVVLFIMYLGYNVYFTTKEGTGSFSDFDINSTANKNIKVELVQEKGSESGRGSNFFVKDKNGVEKMVTLGKEPSHFEMLKR
jgi:hypothetical protein